MARIPYPDLAAASEEFRAIIGSEPLNIVKMMAHAEKPALAILQLGGTLLSGAQLDPKWRELVILRISALSKSAYETRQHRGHARNAGVAAEKIMAVVDGPDDAAFTPAERMLLTFTDEVFLRVKADRARFDEVAGLLSPRELVELLTTIGFYMLICRLLENLEIDIEDDAPTIG